MPGVSEICIDRNIILIKFKLISFKKTQLHTRSTMSSIGVRCKILDQIGPVLVSSPDSKHTVDAE